MANTYKSSAAEQLATGSQTLYTTPLATTTLVKNLYIANVSTSSINVDVIMNKSGSAVNYALIVSASIPVQTSFQPISDPIVLQTGDSLKINTSTISGSDTIMSYLEIT